MFGLTTVELALLVAELVFLGDLEGGLAAPDLVMASEILASSAQVYLSTFFLTLTPLSKSFLDFFPFLDFLDEFLEAAYAGVGEAMVATLPTTRELIESASAPTNNPPPETFLDVSHGRFLSLIHRTSQP